MSDALYCTSCGCAYGSDMRQNGDVCGDLSCWSRIPCAGVLRQGAYNDRVRALQQTSVARDMEGELLASVLAGQLRLDAKDLSKLRGDVAEKAKTLAAECVDRGTVQQLSRFIVKKAHNDQDAFIDDLADLAEDWRELEQLRDEKAWMRDGYSEIGARGCSLCVYEDGVFVRHCKLHGEIDRLRGEIDRLRAACIRTCEETDWCPACKHHPSSKHHDDCPLKGMQERR